MGVDRQIRSVDLKKLCVSPGFYPPFYVSFECTCVQPGPKGGGIGGVDLREGSENLRDTVEWLWEHNRPLPDAGFMSVEVPSRDASLASWECDPNRLSRMEIRDLIPGIKMDVESIATDIRCVQVDLRILANVEATQPHKHGRRPWEWAVEPDRCLHVPGLVGRPNRLSAKGTALDIGRIRELQPRNPATVQHGLIPAVDVKCEFLGSDAVSKRADAKLVVWAAVDVQHVQASNDPRGDAAGSPVEPVFHRVLRTWRDLVPVPMVGGP